MTTKTISLLALLITIFSSCKDATKKQAETTSSAEVQETITTNPIRIEKLVDSPKYENASLTMLQPTNLEMESNGEVDFSFDVQNYELSAQTNSVNTKRLANSGKGQHIHFILNNEPYSAHYDANFKKTLPDGTHHLVAFLSRSYHESVKNENSVVVKKFVIGKNPTDALKMDMNAPTLIYSRPKGTYKGKDADNLLLDFFVLNTTLSEEGHKVRATVNNNVFLITEWAPQILKGLPKGKVTIKLELIDGNGNLLPGAFNSVTREITIE